VPAGKYTVPPPAAAASSMARLIAGLSIVWASPVAPNAVTFRTPARARASAACAGEDAGWLSEGTPARTAPRPAIENNCLRSNKECPFGMQEDSTVSLETQAGGMSSAILYIVGGSRLSIAGRTEFAASFATPLSRILPEIGRVRRRFRLIVR